MRLFGYRPPQKPIAHWKIVLGDQVIINSGAFKGAKGKVVKVMKKRNMVTVQGVNLKFKMVMDDENTRVKKAIQKEAPIHISNVSLIDPQLQIATKINYAYLEDGTKVRVSKKTGALIPKPDRSHLTYFERHKNKNPGPLDTDPELVLEKTYKGEDFLRIEYDFQEYIKLKEAKEKEFLFKS